MTGGPLRILHLEPECYPPRSLDALRAAGELELLEDSDRAALLRRLEGGEYHALFVRLGTAIDEEVLARQPSLRWVVTPTTGLNHIDLAAAERRGVRVVSLAGEQEFLASIRSTAEHTWALLLALVRRIPGLAAQVEQGGWERAGRMAAELDGATLGIVGYGRLGRLVAGYAAAFGMRVLAHDRDPAVVRAFPAVEWRALDELLAGADVVSLHLTGSPENSGFLGAERIARMKTGALLVNTARGEVIDEAALLQALRSGQLGGAALDVLAGDSSWEGRTPTDHPLIAHARTHENLLITPHTGGYGRSSIHRTREFVTRRFLENCRAAADPPLAATSVPNT
jgi:D-3-phosphoglycerate dehydrogenase / 2-oxoglutarate reductase